MAMGDTLVRTDGDSREEILRAAAEFFMKFGYAATSIDAVAEHIGSTKGRVYHHYRSKADLFFDVQITALKRLTAAVEPIARGPGDAVQRLSAMALRHTQILLTELPMQKVAVQGLEAHLLGTSASARRLRGIIKIRDDYERMFAEVIDEGIRDGVFVPLSPNLLTKPFFGALNWATVWFTQRRLQSAEAIEEIAHVLAAFAMRGLLKDTRHDAVRKAPLLRSDVG
jgi:AcrR family transcriptional regulator